MLPRPKSKTVVAETKITVADIDTRTLILKAAAAAKIGESNLTQMDRIVSDTDIVEIPKIDNILVVSCSSSQPVLIDLQGQSETFSIKVNNLYLISGSVPGPVRIRSVDSSQSRITVIFN